MKLSFAFILSILTLVAASPASQAGKIQINMEKAVEPSIYKSFRGRAGIQNPPSVINRWKSEGDGACTLSTDAMGSRERKILKGQLFSFVDQRDETMNTLSNGFIRYAIRANSDWFSNVRISVISRVTLECFIDSKTPAALDKIRESVNKITNPSLKIL